MRLAALLALAATAAAPAPPPPCLTPPEAEAIALVAMPELIRTTGVACAARLPAASLLRRPSSPLLDRYDREAERAWPAARAAIVKLSVPEAELLLGSEYARPLLTTLIAPLLVGRINPDDCGTIDRLVTGLEPLPPRNAATVLVTVLQEMKRKQGKPGGLDRLPLCPAPRP